MNVILPSAAWPNLHYFYYVLNADVVLIEQFDHYGKQSYRNRYEILSANGKLDLSIPVKKNVPKEFTKDIQISYSENWQAKHWRALTSAYKNSPYFEFFEDDIKIFYETQVEFLLNYNLQQLKTVFKLLKFKKEIALTNSFEKNMSNFEDLRETIHPKIDFRIDTRAKQTLEIPYYQTFQEKFPFSANLSILDLLFNQGLESLAYLKNIKPKLFL